MMETANSNGRVSLVKVVRGELKAHVDRWREWRDEHKEEHRDMEKRMHEFESLALPIKVITWVGAALGVSIVGLIWSLLTGQIELVFR